MIQENLAVVRRKMEAAAARGGRAPGDVALIAVTKGVAVSFIHEAIEAGVDHVGESKVQEAAAKRPALAKLLGGRGRLVRWHMVGHLQTNKARDAVRLFDLIHSVDSVRLAQEIDRQAARLEKIQEILLQVNVSAEASKSGFAPADIGRAFDQVRGLGCVRVKGLMTIAPLSSGPEGSRKVFRRLREIRDEISRSADVSWPVLSMGMTDDFEAAVEEGATMVRVGRGIFGERSA